MIILLFDLIWSKNENAGQGQVKRSNFDVLFFIQRHVSDKEYVQESNGAISFFSVGGRERPKI